MSATLLYGLREALALVCREGLENVITRHQKAAAALQSALVELGLQLHVRNIEHRLPTITSVNLPRDIDWKQIVDFAATEYVLHSHKLPFIRFNFMCEFNCFCSTIFGFIALDLVRWRLLVDLDQRPVRLFESV